VSALSGQDLALLADVIEVLEHSVDGDAVPQSRQWCYVNGPSFAKELRALRNRLVASRGVPPTEGHPK
jgi:hypothetical protein